MKSFDELAGLTPPLLPQHRRRLTFEELAAKPESTASEQPTPKLSEKEQQKADDEYYGWLSPLLEIFPFTKYLGKQSPYGGLLAGSIAENVANFFDGTLAAKYSPLIKSAIPSAREFSDESLKYGLSKLTVDDYDTASGAFMNSTGSSVYGIAGGINRMFGADKSADALNKAASALYNRNRVSTDDWGEYFTNPRGLVADFGTLAGSQLAMAPVLPLVNPMTRGLTALGTRIGGNALMDFLIGQGHNKTAKFLANQFPQLMAYNQLMGTTEGLAEGGEAVDEALREGLSKDEAYRRGWEVAGYNVPLLGVTNGIEAATMFAPVPRVFKKIPSVLDKSLQIAGRGLVSSLQEQAEEAYQRAIQDAVAGRDFGVLPWNFTDAQWEATDPVKIAAAIPGLLGGTFNAFRTGDPQSDWITGDTSETTPKGAVVRADYAATKDSYEKLRSYAREQTAANVSDKEFNEVFDTIIREAISQGVDPRLALSIALAESTGDQSAISPVGAIGVMQLMPETAQALGVDPYDMKQNVRGGVQYLKDMLDTFGGDRTLAIAAYNAGPNAVKRYGDVPPYSETQKYVGNVNGYLEGASKLVATADTLQDMPSFTYNDGGNRRGGNSPSQGTVYLGENGGGEGKYWVRNTSMGATLDGAQPQTINALDILAKKYYEDTGKRLVLNAGTNGTSHAQGEHSHYTGWKLDVIDEYVEGEDSPLITANYQPGWLWNEFRDFGRSIGLGMNFEAPGSSNVHIDIAIDGDNWIDKAPNSGGFSLDKVRAAANGTQGSPSSPSQGNEQGDAYDPEFSPRENEIWQWAQYASNRLRNEYQIRLAPELIFRQWWFEDSTQGKFDHPSHNFGGLTSIKPTNLPKPGGGYFAEYSSDKEFADAYVDDFMRLRKDEINAAADENGMMSDEAFIQAMLASGYMVEGDVPSYRANFPGIKAPSKRNSGGGTSKTSPTQTPNVQPVDIPEEPKPLFDITAEDDKTKKLIEQFANERYHNSTGEGAVADIDFFSSMFDKKGNFRNTKENRDAIRNEFGTDLTDWANSILAQEQEQAAPQPQAPSPKATQQPQPIAQPQTQSQAQAQPVTPIQPATTAQPTVTAQGQPTQSQAQLTQPTQDPVSQNGTPENVLTPAPSSQGQAQPTAQPQAQVQSNVQGQPTAQPQVQPATAPKKIGGVEGNTAQVLTDNRSRYAVKYKVVEADDLNASHNFDATTGASVNPNYPQEFQPRDRQRQVYEEHVEERANHLDPTRLMESENVNQGAPVVRSDGVVLNGNGRVMSIRRAYDKGLGDNYRNALIENAQRLGLNGDEISAMKKPVLVRETAQDLDVEGAKPIVGSTQGGESLGATEQAGQDAQAIRDNSNLLSNVPADGDFSTANAQNFIADVLRAIVPENERNTVMNNGAPTVQGISRVRNALFALGYQDDKTLQRAAEDPSDNIKRVTNAMVAAAPKFAQARTQMESLGLDQTYLDPLIQAVGKFKALRDAGSSVFRHLMDIPIEGMDNESEETKDILAFFEAHKGNQTEIAQFLRALADGILNYTETQGGLFGTSPLNLKNIIASARSQVEGTELTADMFQNEALRKQIAKQVHKTLQTGRSEGRKFLVNRLFSQAQNGDDFAVRMLNRFKGLNPTARDLQQEANPNETTSTSETTTAQGSQENPVQNAEPQQTQEPSQVKRYPEGSKAWKLHRKLKTDSHPNLREYADDLIERAQSRYEEVYKPARDRIDEILKTDYTDEQLDDWDNRLAAQSEASPEVQAESSSSEHPQATPNVEATPQVQADTESATVTTGEVQTEAKRKLSPVAWSPLQALSLDDTPETATIPHRLFKKLEHLPQFAESLLAQAQSDDEAVHTKAQNEIQTILKGNFTDEELEARARLFDAQNDGQSTVKPPNAKRDRILGAKRPAGLKGKRYPEDSVGRKLQRRLKDAYPHLSQHVDDLLEKAKNDEDARTELKAILAASDEVLAEMEQNLAPQEEIQPTANVDETSNADETGETNDNRLPANVDESPSRESPSKRRLVKGRTGKIKRYSHGSKGFALQKKLQTEAHPNLREYADDLLERAAVGDEQARAEIDSVLDGYYSDELLDKWERILNPQEAEQSAEVQPETRTEAQSETSAETQEETTPEAPKAEESKTSAEVQPETQSEPAPQEATEPESLSATEESSQTEAQTKPETESSQEGTTPQTQTQANEGASASTQEAESQRESTPESFKKFFRQLGTIVSLKANPLEGKVSHDTLLDALRGIVRANDGKVSASGEHKVIFTFTSSINSYTGRVIATAAQNAKEFIDEATKYLSDIATGRKPLPQEKPKETPKAEAQAKAKAKAQAKAEAKAKTQTKAEAKEEEANQTPKPGLPKTKEEVQAFYEQEKAQLDEDTRTTSEKVLDFLRRGLITVKEAFEKLNRLWGTPEVHYRPFSVISAKTTEETFVVFNRSLNPLNTSKRKIPAEDLQQLLDDIAYQYKGAFDEDKSNDEYWYFAFEGEDRTDKAEKFKARATYLLEEAAATGEVKKLEDCVTFKELQTYFKERHNATIDDKVKYLDFDGVKEFLTGVEKTFAEFSPRFAGRIHHIASAPLEFSEKEIPYAQLDYSGYNKRKDVRIVLNQKAFTQSAIGKIRENLAKPDGNLVSSSIEGLGAHEAGHAIHGLIMTKMGFRYFTATKGKKGVVVSDSKDDFASEFIRLVCARSSEPTLKKAAPKRDGKATRKKLKEEISSYATKNDSECIAEAVGDVMENGENAKPLSKAIFAAMKQAAEDKDIIDITKPFEYGTNGLINTDTWRYKLLIDLNLRKSDVPPWLVNSLSPSTVWAWYQRDLDRIGDELKNKKNFPRRESESDDDYEKRKATERKQREQRARDIATSLLPDSNLKKSLVERLDSEVGGSEIRREYWEESLGTKATELAKKDSKSAKADWENEFSDQTPDEAIMQSSDEWTPEKINEAAKIHTVAKFFEDHHAIIENGKVSFPDESVKKDCINHLKAIETPDLTLSEEWVDGRPPNRDLRNYVAVKDLNPFQRALYEFAQKLGVTVSFFRGDPNFHGTHLYGISYINVDAKRSASFVFWHEFGHWLKNNQPELYKAIADSIEITQEQIDEKRDTRPDLSDDELRDEIIFDAFRNAAQREGLFKLIGKQDKNLLERFVSWAKAVLDRFTDWFRKPDRGLTTAQANQMQAAFGKMIRSLTDEHGKKIFRVNNNTHVIEHIDGRALHTWNLDAKAGYSFAGEKAKTAQKKHMKAALTKAIQMEENGASRQEIFDATGWFKGKDGKWRFEIVDDFEKIHLTPLDKRKKATLGEIYHNAALYKAYPPLAKMTVRVYSQADFENDNVKTAMGYYSTARKEIVLNPEYRYDWKEVLVHELQHAVQDIEGFAQGGSGKYAREILVTRGEDISGLSDRDLWFKLGGEQEAEEVRERAEARRKAKIKALSNADRVKAYGKLRKIKSEQSPEIQRLADEYEREIRSKGFTDSARQRKIEKKLPAELREAIVDVHFADVMAKNAVESSGDNVPTIHGEKVLLIYDGKTTSLSFAGANAHTADHDDIRYSGNRNTETPASTKWTDERITEAAKNPQIFNGLTQDGAKLKDGKIVFPNKQARENAIKFLNAVTNPNFKFSIAWHGSPHQFDEFSLDEIGSGEGEQAHGWGLYFTADRKVAEKYRELLTRKSDVVMKVGKRKFVYHGNRWVDEKGNRISFANRQSFDNDALRVLLSETFQILGGESVTKERILRWLQERLRQEQQFFDSSKIRLELAEERLVYYQKHRNAPKAEYLETFREVRLSKQAVADCESKVSELKDALALAADIEVSHLPPSEGSVLKVEVPDADVMLNEAETLDNQPPKVQTALREIAKERGITLSENMTGEEIYDNIVRTFDYDYASASKLLNKHGVKGIVYDETDPVMDDGHCYVVFDDKAIKILERFPELERRGKLENYLQDDELTTVQKAIQEFCKRMGVPVKFFRSHSDTQGAFQEGTAFINVNSVATPEWVFHHEVGHWLAVNNPQLFNRLVEILDITPEQRDAYRKATKQPDLTDNQVDAEILCDKMGDIAQRLQLFKDVGKADASLVERLVAWFKAALDKFTDFFFKKENGLTRSQRDRLYGTFGKIVRAIVDEKGNRLFRYNNETHAIERADGTPLPQIALTEANAKEGVKYSFAGKKAKTASSSRIAAAELMERRGASKDEIFKATGFVRGRDGLWRFEIEDDLDKIDFNTLVFQNGNGVATLGEIYDNPKLYAAYPDLKSMTVTAFATDDKTVGEYLPVTNSIILNTKHTGKWKTTLVHEIQHAIQEKEGFAKGGSPKEVYDQLVRNKEALEKHIAKLPKGSKDRKLFESMLNSVQQGINDLIAGRKTDDEAYWQLGGEQEAREVADRAEARQQSKTPKNQAEAKRSRKFADESWRKLNGLLANQSARVQSLTREYLDALKQDEERADDLRKILPKDVLRAADTAFYAEEDANFRADDGRGTPTIHDKNAIIALDKFGRSASSAGKKGFSSQAEAKAQAKAQREKVQEEYNAKAKAQREAAEKKRAQESAKKETEAERGFIGKLLDKLAKALHLKGDRIINEEDQLKAGKRLKEKAMQTFLNAQEAHRQKPTKATKEALDKARIEMHRLGVKSEELDAFKNGETLIDEIGGWDYTIASPSRIADKVRTFRLFFRLADNALDKLIELRAKFARKYQAALELVAKKEDRETLFGLLWKGDKERKEFGKLTKEEIAAAKAKRRNGESETQAIRRAKIEKICAEQGVSKNVAQAYLGVRDLIRMAFANIAEARRHPQMITKRLSDSEIEELRNNKFVELNEKLIAKAPRDANGKRLVTYKAYEYREHSFVVSFGRLAQLEEDDAIQILDTKRIRGGFIVKVREGFSQPEELEGYIPHLFHEYRVVVKDADGNQVGSVLFTAKTEREAVKLAEEWKSKNKLKDGENIFICPKGLSRQLGIDAEKLAPILGDKDFAKMTERLSKVYDMSLDDLNPENAQKRPEVKRTSRNRFMGNLIDRTDEEGFAKDMDWVLRHYFHVATRYTALESHFKPQAITYFERIFGAFDAEYGANNLLAKYTKQFILDVNGNPTFMEEILNKTFNRWKFTRTFVAPMFEGRKFLTVTDTATRFVAYAKLGFFNVSSAVLNLTQFINAAPYVGWTRLAKHATKLVTQRGKLTQSQLRILTESGVIDDLGLDTVSDFDKNQVLSPAGSYMDKIDYFGNKSMILFQTLDSLCRASSTLAAYEQATEQGKSKQQALEYAKGVNRKANFSYGMEDAPNIFRRSGPLGKVMLQFYKYPIKQLELMFDMLPRNKATTNAQKVAFWGPYFLLCGLMGLIPGFDWGDDFLNKHLNLFPKDFVEKTTISACQSIFGQDSEAAKKTARMLLYGGGALLNVDTSSRVGLAGFMPRDFEGFLLGAAGSTVRDTTRNFVNGDYTQALRSLSPGLFNIYAAIAGESETSRDRLNMVYDTAWKRIVRAIGFRSADESAVSDKYRIFFNDQAKLKRERDEAIDDYFDEPSAENVQRLSELGVTRQMIENEMRRKHSTRLERLDEGIIPKNQRAKYHETFGNLAEPD